jgi:hypothetical protein
MRSAPRKRDRQIQSRTSGEFFNVPTITLTTGWGPAAVRLFRESVRNLESPHLHQRSWRKKVQTRGLVPWKGNRTNRVATQPKTIAQIYGLLVALERQQSHEVPRATHMPIPQRDTRSTKFRQLKSVNRSGNWRRSRNVLWPTSVRTGSPTERCWIGYSAIQSLETPPC